ncbi:peptidase C13-like protein [Acidovorax delafieldii]|uniref:Peptidase C13-like protein n=1 Tax=Acidovorax delafieldii TaxID=47920 RepID=A0A561XIN7_ACIDE|nr:C13 family peptidase [Acidovorax delafieldii]TWG35976.1 peptidase C13-like protein [Acidovorax delafieldii]
MKDLNASSSTWADTLPSQWGPELAHTEIEVPLSRSPQDLPTSSAIRAISATERLSLWGWMREGLRAALFLAPRTGAAAPTPWQLLVLSLISGALLVGAARLQVAGPAQFSVRGWLTPMWSSLVLLWLAWWAMAPAQRAPTPAPELGVPGPSGGLAAWYVLSAWAPLAPLLVLYVLMALAVHQPALWNGTVASILFWVAYGVLTVWVLATLVVVSARFIRSRVRTAVFGVAMAVVVGVGMWQFQDQPWEEDALAVADASAASADGAQPPEPAQLALSQGLFENQQLLWQQQVDALLPQRPGVVDVYGLVFAPYADENVFRRESTMVNTLLQERFDAQGRVLHLLNHAETAETHPWATPENLQRAIAALAARMDREHDVLVIYMTSHGARNHELAAAHWPLQVPPVTPEMLRAALDESGIRNRVIAVSACFSGGWIEPLATDSTLIMTAADATHTSYGCGRLSELTFFGRAVFHEQLRQSHSFTEAFAKAVPLIQQREVEAGKADGFSNPQIRVGQQIAPVLQALEQRLQTEAPNASSAAPAPAADAPSPVPATAAATDPATAPPPRP